MNPLKKTNLALAALLLCLPLTACRSAFVQTSIVNHSGSPVQLIEVDYPNASFGTQQIADNTTYRYAFKIQDPGPVKISYTGAKNKIYKATGPGVYPGQAGNLIITIEADGKVTWIPELRASK